MIEKEKEKVPNLVSSPSINLLPTPNDSSSSSSTSAPTSADTSIAQQPGTPYAIKLEYLDCTGNEFAEVNTAQERDLNVILTSLQRLLHLSTSLPSFETMKISFHKPLSITAIKESKNPYMTWITDFKFRQKVPPLETVYVKFLRPLLDENQLKFYGCSIVPMSNASYERIRLNGITISTTPKFKLADSNTDKLFLPLELLTTDAFRTVQDYYCEQLAAEIKGVSGPLHTVLGLGGRNQPGLIQLFNSTSLYHISVVYVVFIFDVFSETWKPYVGETSPLNSRWRNSYVSTVNSHISSITGWIRDDCGHKSPLLADEAMAAAVLEHNCCSYLFVLEEVAPDAALSKKAAKLAVKKSLKVLEAKWIKSLKSNTNGYNKTMGKKGHSAKK